MRTTPLLALALAAVACGPEIPQGLGTTSSGSPSSQSTQTKPADAGSSSATAPDASTAGPTVTVDSAAVIATIAQGAYLTPSFKEVTRAPYESVAKPGSMIREWVNTSSLAAYEGISPGMTGSGVIAPVGTTIVRAVLAADGSVGTLTLMYKGPSGYNPALGDWWFGVTAPDGTPAEEDGGAELGLLTACFSCHVPRQNDSYLFGVPLDDRASDDGGAGGTTTTDAGTSSGMDAGMDAGDDADTDAGHDGGHHHGGRMVEGEAEGE